MMTATGILVLAVAMGTIGVMAKEEFVSRIPNGANVPGVAAIGHSDGTGNKDARNAFGKAFDSAGNKWTTTLCKADTDGDGQTNGQELGDPCCEWTPGATPRYKTASHPSDATKKVDSSLYEAISCPPATPAPSSASINSIATLLATAAAGLAALL